MEVVVENGRPDSHRERQSWENGSDRDSAGSPEREIRDSEGSPTRAGTRDEDSTEICSTDLVGEASEGCDSLVVFSDGGVERGREGRLLQLSWEADSTWSLRTLTLLLECARLRMLMAWCSTLGGAHSSLGESFTVHAEKAGVISVQQLALATDMRDPLLAAQCRIFAAYSLLQRGRLKPAAKIIKQQYRYATQEAVTLDEKLVRMCQAAWARLQALQTLRDDSIQEIS